MHTTPHTPETLQKMREANLNGRTLCIDCHRITPTWGRKELVVA